MWHIGLINNIKFHFHDFAWKWFQNQWNFLTIIKLLSPLVIFTCIIKWWHYHGTKKVLQYFSMIKSNIYLANVPIVIENWHILTFVLFFQYCYLTIHCLRGKQSFENNEKECFPRDLGSRSFLIQLILNSDYKALVVWIKSECCVGNSN